jgi:hypothetical protein
MSLVEPSGPSHYSLSSPESRRAWDASDSADQSDTILLRTDATAFAGDPTSVNS